MQVNNDLCSKQINGAGGITANEEEFYKCFTLKSKFKLSVALKKRVSRSEVIDQKFGSMPKANS